MMPPPNFLLIGVAKAGTTALYEALRQHPQIFMSPVKEPRFFTFADSPLLLRGPGGKEYQDCAIISWDQYLALFQDVTDQIAIGEASQDYLSCWHPARTAEHIRRRLPAVKLIAVLRQPAERAYSSFAHQYQVGNERRRDFRAMLQEAALPERAEWLSYRCFNDGFYYDTLKSYFERFPPEQIRVYLYEDWNTQPHQVLADIFTFLGVAPSFIPQMSTRHNVTTWTRSEPLARLLREPFRLKALVRASLPATMRKRLKQRLSDLNRVEPPPLDRRLRRELTAAYRPSILQLQDLIGRDLSRWLD